MCVIKDIEELPKKIFVYMNDGKVFSSPWFNDDERKNTYGQSILTELEQENYDSILERNNLEGSDVNHWAINRDKSQGENCVFISRHGFDRMKERNGWNRKTAMRMAKKIFDNGLSPNEVKGDYRPWVRHKAEQNPHAQFKFYGQNLYVFENNILITVLTGVKLFKQEVDAWAC